MRGKVVAHCVRQNAVRITPAYAGKRPGNVSGAHNVWDHPRVCGEKQVNTVDTYPPAGSPPAYAGKSPGDENRQDAARDHPRVCGEKKIANSDELAVEGSPPRMRGKVLKNRVKSGQPRITPAYAGKRLKRSRSTVPPVAIVPLFPSVCNKPVVSDGSPAGRDAPLFLPAENAVPASPAYNLRSL